MTPNERALEWALGAWLSRIRDPARSDHLPDAERGRVAILEYIQKGLGWSSWVKAYPGDGSFAWCGAFAAIAWAQAGVSVETRKKHFASTYRLDRWGKRNPLRKVATSSIIPGDIVVVDTGGGKDYGDHITLALAYDKQKATLATVEGNGQGFWPDGTWVEGVVVCIRPRTDIRATYRPIQADFGGE